MLGNNGTEQPLSQLFFSVCFLGIYRPRALPSAGLFPFARSFLCDFKSTKTNDPNEILNGLPDLRSSRYIVYTIGLRKLFQHGTKQYLSTCLHAETCTVQCYQAISKIIQIMFAVLIKKTTCSGG